MGPVTAMWCVGLVAGSAMGQVVTPPPGIPKPRPEYVRPEFTPVVPPEIRVRPKRPDVTGIEFDTLAQLGDDGMIIRVSEPVDYAALGNNPLLGPEQWEQLGPWLVERNRRMEQLVIENIDAVIEIDFGIIDQIFAEQQEQFAVIMELIRPLSITATIGDDLHDANLFSPEQTALNNMISLEYRGKVIDEIQKTFVPEPDDESTAVDHILRYVFWENAQEPIRAYRLMLIEAAPQLSGWLKDLEVEQEEAAAINSLLAKHNEGLNDEATLAIMRRVIDELETAQVRLMLKKTVAAREKGDG